MEELITKENDIFDILQKFLDFKLDFIVVGGYAVSAFKHRFSVDADIVIQSTDLDKFELASRTTNASFSYRLLNENSMKKEIIGIEKKVIAKIPIKELLITSKIHSGRLTDIRDIVALARGSDIDMIKKFLFIGDLKVIKENLDKIKKALNEKGFIDSFKGVFMEKKFDVDINQAKKISDLKPLV